MADRHPSFVRHGGDEHVVRREHPELRFDVGSMTELDFPENSLAGVLAWQSLIHLPNDEVVGVLERFTAWCVPAARCNCCSTSAMRCRRKRKMRLPVHRRRPEHMENWLHINGFVIEAQLVRDPRGDAPQAILFARNNF